ncbi:MAG: LemA family protein [Deltaproteobacteria bacterium]|nr:LemA family protein [Deltaproteobacteria bacterium]MBW2084912.1 LemA family protein [Deltaproteobacteria bacterium]
MANFEGISTEELKTFLFKNTQRLRLLKGILIGVIIFLVVILIGHAIYYYNRLTIFKYDVQNAGAKVESAIQYRVNLVPVLIRSVVDFVAHEDNVFIQAVDARERSLTMAGQVSKELQKSAGRPIEEILDKIMAIAEQYPDLKVSESFQLLMKLVADTEVEILKQRINYNDKVNVYSTAKAVFPGNIYSVLFGFSTYNYFEGSRQSEWLKSVIQK